MAGTARPSDVDLVIWRGSVEPSNATNDDIWIETGADVVTLAPASLVGVKAADQTVNNSTTFVDATGMTVAVEASTDYLVSGDIFFRAPATGDFAGRWSLPAGAAGRWSLIGFGASKGGGDADAVFTAYAPALMTDSVSLGGINWGDAGAKIGGLLRVGGTAGAFTFQFAQAVAEAADTILRADSWMRLERV